MSALPGQDSGASDKSREGGDSGGGKRDEVYEQSRATVAREEEDDDQEEETAWSAADRNRLNFSILSAETAASEHQQQAAGRVIDAVKSESVGIDGVGRGYWRELETESLRGQVRGLRRQVEMMTSAAEAQSAVTTAADQVNLVTTFPVMQWIFLPFGGKVFHFVVIEPLSSLLMCLAV